MSSFSELRFKLQENWREAHPARVSRAALSTRTDGVIAGSMEIDQEELDVLTRQLTSQMEYNNLLLEHLQALEQAQLEAQREMKRKDQAIKAALVAQEAARTEGAEARRKWSVAAEVAEAMTRKCEEARAQTERKARELELHRQQLEDIKALYQDVLQQSSVMESRVAHAQATLEQTSCEASRRAAADVARIRELECECGALEKELQSLREKHFPMASEYRRAAESMVEMERRVDHANDRAQAEARARAQAEAHIRGLEASLLEAREASRGLSGLLEEERSKTTQLQAEVDALKEAKRAAEAEVGSRELWIAEARREHKEIEDENRALKSELEQVGNDLLAQAKQRGVEQERWALKLAKAQEHLAAITEQASRDAHRHASDMEARSAEHTRARKDAEEAYVKLQQEHQELHELLKAVQAEHRERLEAFEAERTDYQQRIHQLKEQVCVSEEAVDARTEELCAEVGELREENKALRHEVHTRAERYVSMLDTLQKAVRGLSRDGTACRDRTDAIAQDFEVLQKAVRTFAASQGPPLDDWYAEVCGGFDGLVDQTRSLHQTCEAKEEELRGKEVRVEQLKADVAAHEADLSSLKHELSEADSRLSRERATAQDRLKVAHVDLETARREKEEVERHLRRVQETLESSNGQNKQLQERAQALARQVAELLAEKAATTKRAEDHASALDLGRRELERAMQSVMAEREDMTRNLQDAEKDRHAMAERARRTEAMLEQQEREYKDLETRANRKLGETNALLTHTIRQLESTQKLLHVMRQGKAESDDQVQQLQLEMGALQQRQQQQAKERQQLRIDHQQQPQQRYAHQRDPSHDQYPQQLQPSHGHVSHPHPHQQQQHEDQAWDTSRRHGGAVCHPPPVHASDVDISGGAGSRTTVDAGESGGDGVQGVMKVVTDTTGVMNPRAA